MVFQWMTAYEINQPEFWWKSNGFEVINSEPRVGSSISWYAPMNSQFGSSLSASYTFVPPLYDPSEVIRLNSDVPLSDEVKCVFNNFHLKKPMEQWENYNEICELFEVIRKELSSDD